MRLKGRAKPGGCWWFTFLLVLPLIAAWANLDTAGAVAAPPQVWQVCESGSGAAECDTPRGIAADPDTGQIFVSDQLNRRINVFTSWGQFVRAWGWDIVASGPNDTNPVNELEVCVPAEGDVCQAGDGGTGGAGQFNAAAGIAIDSEGNVYAAEAGTPRRVQKFSPDGDFLLSFGGGVNQGGGSPENPGNICTKEHLENGDTCGAGKAGTGPGEFSGPGGSLRTVIAIAPGDSVYVGDKERIQRFDTEGEYQDEIPIPGEGVQQVAADGAGFLYVSYELSTNEAKPNIRKLDPASATPGAPVDELEIANPRAIAATPAGEIYAFNEASAQIVHFDSSGEEVESFGESLSSASTGIAVNEVDGEGGIDVYFPNNSPSFVRAYGVPPEFESPPLEPPAVKAQYAVSVETTEARLRALINPEFWPDTTFYLEYGTGECASGGCPLRVPVAGETTLTDEVTNADLTTPNVSLTGLAPSTAYHYRFVAKSSGGGPIFGIDPDGEGEEEQADFESGLQGTFTTHPAPSAPKSDCPNQAFRFGASAFLPDCRAFEMVSPVDKNGAGIETQLALGSAASNLVHAALDQSAADGKGLTYSSKQPFGDQVSSPKSSQYLSRRNLADGWTTQGINAPFEGFPGFDRNVSDVESKAFNDDLSESWLVHDGEPPLSECAPGNSPVLYRRDNSNNSYDALHCEPTMPVNFSGTIEFMGFSADGCRAVFRSTGRLTEGAESGGPWQLYESNCEGGLPLLSGKDGLQLVSVLPGGLACPTHSAAGTTAGVGNSGEGRTSNVTNAFSADAHRLYWTCGNTMYLRTDPMLKLAGDEEVIKVADPVLGERPRFQAASADGATMLYTAYNETLKAYELQVYDAEKEASTPIASGLGSSSVNRLEILGASEDATRVYFASTEVLASAPNSEGEVAVAGKPNLYFHELGGGFAFIGTLADGDLSSAGADYSSLHQLPFRRASRVSPDGLHAAFISSAPLTGYDNTDVASGETDAEVFLYDAEPGGVGELACVSCNPSGQRPRGAVVTASENAGFGGIWGAAWIPGWQTQLYEGRPLSEDGERLFFNSFDSLVLRDTNNRADVYEWERSPGKTHCVEELGGELHVPASGGCLSLISTGEDDQDSEFVDADRDGSDVFIRTGESLVPQDPGLVDIYDARVDGGFPPPPGDGPECEGEACQSPPPPPAFQPPSSSSYKGPPSAKASSCLAPARSAKRFAQLARGLRRQARSAATPEAARKLRAAAARSARRARGLSRQAQRCRRERGQTSRASQAGRAGR